MNDLKSYEPLDPEVIKKKKIDFFYLGYYLRWIPQEMYYYAVKNVNFKPNTERNEGTYSKYASLDDRIDGFFITQAILNLVSVEPCILSWPRIYDNLNYSRRRQIFNK